MFPVSFINFMHYYVGYREFLMQNVTIWAQIQTFSSFLHCTTIIHQEKGTFALIYYILISTNVMTLIGSVNLSHGTDACIHLQLIQYYEKMSKWLKVYNFIIPVQWRVVLWKCCSHMFMGSYWKMQCSMWFMSNKVSNMQNCCCSHSS